MTEEQAVAKIYDQFHSRIKAPGLGKYMVKIKQAETDEAVLAIAAELDGFPVWRGMQSAIQRQRITPEMYNAIGVLMDLKRAGLEETDKGKIAMMRVMELSPEWLLDEFGDMAREMGVMPSKPDGYTDEDEPMFSLDAIGAALGLNEEDAAVELERFMELRVQAGLSNDGIVTDGRSIHGVQ